MFKEWKEAVEYGKDQKGKCEGITDIEKGRERPKKKRRKRIKEVHSNVEERESKGNEQDDMREVKQENPKNENMLFGSDA